MFLGFTSFYHIPATLVLVTTQFLPQIAFTWRLRHNLKSTSISVWTLGLQMILFALLGISWRLRLGTIGVGWTSEWTIKGPADWYELIGWRCLKLCVICYWPGGTAPHICLFWLAGLSPCKGSRIIASKPSFLTRQAETSRAMLNKHQFRMIARAGSEGLFIFMCLPRKC